MQRRVLGNQCIEVGHPAVPPEITTRPILTERRANHVAFVVYTLSDARTVPVKRAQVLHALLPGPKKSVRAFVAGNRRSADRVTLVIKGQRHMSDAHLSNIYRPTEVAEVLRSAVLVPEHGVRPKGDGRKQRIRTRARRANGLAAVIDRDGHSHRIAGQRTEYADIPQLWPPDHGLKTENLWSCAIDGNSWRARRIHRCIFSDPGRFASIVHCADRAVVASQQRELSHHSVFPKRRQTRESGAIGAKVFVPWILRRAFRLHQSLPLFVEGERPTVRPSEPWL